MMSASINRIKYHESRGGVWRWRAVVAHFFLPALFPSPFFGFPFPLSFFRRRISSLKSSCSSLRGKRKLFILTFTMLSKGLFHSNAYIFFFFLKYQSHLLIAIFYLFIYCCWDVRSLRNSLITIENTNLNPPGVRLGFITHDRQQQVGH